MLSKIKGFLTVRLGCFSAIQPYLKCKQTQLILNQVRHTGILYQFKTGMAEKNKYVIYHLGWSG